jgi:PhnB protein
MAFPTTPAGYHTVTPYLTTADAGAAIDFYKAAFGAVETCRLTMPDGTICHAEVKIGDSHVMLGQECPAWGNKSPNTLGGTPVGLCVYLPDVDAAFAKAVAVGATVDKPVEDQFYGDRSGTVTDPFGHKWTLATHVEDVSPAEMQRRMDAWIVSMGQEQAKAA